MYNFATAWRYVIWIWIGLQPASLIAQEGDSLMSVAPNSLAEKIRAGEVVFHVKSFYMGTVNKGDLLDYHTLGLGAGIGYVSPVFKGFHVGFSGFFVFQLYEHNLRIPDPATGNVNRYEILLYDMNDFENSRDLDRLEHLYLSYKKRGFQAVFGRQQVDTPFLNEQDNRMRPNIFSGLKLTYENKSWHTTFAWFDHVTMRGTVDWYSIEESIGVYPFGRNVFGTSSGYKGNIRSRGVGVAGISYKGVYGESLQYWSYLAENVFQMQFVQIEKQTDLGSADLMMGFQGFYQSAWNDGGNTDPDKAYIMAGERSWGFGSKLGVQVGKQSLSLNLLAISDQGRFLFPREWGREVFFASLPRERFEGNGGVRAISLKYDYRFNKHTQGLIGVSTVSNPDINDFSLNKYGVPSYYHFVGSVDHSFDGYLEGLKLKLLLVNKAAKEPGEIPDSNRINRVDLWNINLVIDYKF
ncbi:OprD family outer membrane porin [Lunatimonas salinarum]|uniref:OprD family outer membrane porin n=1 Tax=Lunatimonas salinarum TaxID=1774590 RepID=UPI001FD78F49|nr:OprD family outer membrane porin [Lunatimonas salinarum]